MKKLLIICGVVIAALTTIQVLGDPPRVSRLTVYREMCDASAAVALNDTLFIAASDEDNILRVYSSEQAGAPLLSHDMSPFLGVKSDHETDIEGATRLGDRIYWITSHSRNAEGEEKPRRRKLFATRVTVRGATITIAGVGKPYNHLLADLLAEPRLRRYSLAEAARRKPKAEGALDIEGLTATPEGTLLIGFRNPIPQGKALLVPLLNPQAILDGETTARLGDAMELDLGGLGIRSIEYWPAQKTYLISAGPASSGGPFRLYRWAGGRSDVPIPVPDVDFGDLHPEAIIVYPNPMQTLVQILSDDGSRKVNGKRCKDLPLAERRFRSIWVRP